MEIKFHVIKQVIYKVLVRTKGLEKDRASTIPESTYFRQSSMTMHHRSLARINQLVKRWMID